MGAWIEITMRLRISPRATVAPLVGAWIEISHSEVKNMRILSHPLWVRGLKSQIAEVLKQMQGRTPCGCVD